jgi:hypothetical protein
MSPKSRNRKKQIKSNSPKPPVRRKRNYGFEWRSSPFEGLTPEQADEAFVKIGEAHGVTFEESFRTLRKEILKYDPVYLLSVNSFYSTFDSNAKPANRSYKKRILQHHVELLQSLTLLNDSEAYKSSFAPPPAIQEVRELLYDCSNSFPMRRYSTLAPSMSLEQRQRLRVLEDIRGHTQALRNWGYPQQIERIVLELFAPLDDIVESKTGVRLRSLISMVFTVSDLLQNRINAHVKDLHPALTAPSTRKAVETYLKLIPGADADAEALMKILSEKRATLRQTRLFLMSHSDLRLPDVYSLAFEDFIDAYPDKVDKTALSGIIESWSYAFGDLAGENPEHFFMGNPIWRRPLIKLDDDIYLMPVPGLFLSFCLELMEDLIDRVPKLNAMYLSRRGKFLEEDIARLFVSTFPSAEVYRGSLWQDTGSKKQFENDLLVLLDSYQIVVEAKSGKVSDPARRGAVSRLEGEIKKLMVEPSIQAKRFAEYLERNRGKHRLATRDGSVNEFDNSTCHETIRLSVTLDILANLQARWTDLRRAGLIAEDADLGPTMSLTDLELVFDLLGLSCEKIHYLARRTEFERNARYLADESDLLAFYIDNGFSIGDSEYDGTPLLIYGVSEILDPYYMQQWTGEKAPKPARRYTKWWKRILERMDQQLVARWTEIGYMLLNLGYEEQVLFEKEFRRVQRMVRKTGWVLGDTNAYVFLTGAEKHRNAVIGVAYKQISTEQRNNMLREATIPAFDKEPIKRALVIGVDVENTGEPLPYSVIACALK